jgi:hypothetical protein
MKVYVKVVMNQAEINKAQAEIDTAIRTNTENEQKRNFYKANPEAEKETLIDVKVPALPKPKIVDQPLLFDLNKVSLVTIGDAGMIYFVYEGKGHSTENKKEVWEKFESRFDEQANQYCKNALCAHNN